MLDIQFIREHPDKVKANNKLRGCDVDVGEILKLDEKRRSLITEIDEKRAELKSKSKTKPWPDEIKKLKSLGDSVKKLEEKLAPIESELRDLASQLPNMTHESVPKGRDEKGNQEVKTWGKKPKFDFDPKDHAALGAQLDLIDTERGAKVSGARFWYLKNDLVTLQFALTQYAAEFMSKKGFTPMLVPMLVREHAMFGTGFFPAERHEYYQVNQEEDDLFLIGTSEVPLASYHANETIDVSEPLKYFGYSSCFRREAGAYGKDTTGIIRGHQFDKVEMFVFCAADQSWGMHEAMLAISEEFWQSLKIPYRVMNMCAGDIGAPNAKKYDIEGWFPGQNAYRELASCSNDTDFQARRLGIKYKDKGESKFVHTLNNTVCAMGRTMIVIMENFQQEDGSIEIPKVLRKYRGGQKKIEIKN